MKFFIMSLFFFSMIAKASGGEGVVVVLEAPLLQSPSLKSKVLTLLRKGDRIFISEKIIAQKNFPQFIPTFDRAGNRAYMPAEYIKVVTNDEREKRDPVNLTDHDPTDYRLREPIPSSYPYENKTYSRVSLSFFMGNNLKAPYEYNGAFSSQEYQAEMGARLLLTRELETEKYSRFYFGFIAAISNSRNVIHFQDQSFAKEGRGILRGGPFMTFDAYRNDELRFLLGFGATLNYHRSTLSMESGDRGEELLFSGFSLSPMASAILQGINIFPGIDLIAGVDAAIFLPYSQSSSNAVEYPALWGNQQKIKSSFAPQASLFVGVQVPY